MNADEERYSYQCLAASRQVYLRLSLLSVFFFTRPLPSASV
jgi:hypothetical protein